MAVKDWYRIYWSALETYRACPRQFLWKRGWGDIDLGRGAGISKKPPVMKSEHYLLLGSVVGKAIEDFYNKKFWKDPKSVREKMTSSVKKALNKGMSKRYLDWDVCPSKREMLKACLESVLDFLITMKKNRLLCAQSEAEMEILSALKNGIQIGGKLDIYVPRDGLILEGKNTTKPGAYVSEDQLRWYALCHLLGRGEPPKRLAFVYWKFPWGRPPEKWNGLGTWTGLVDVPFTNEDFFRLAREATDFIEGLEKNDFPPRPKPKHCRYCEFETVCPERVAQKEANSKKRGKRKKEKAKGSLDHLFIENTGDLTITFGLED